MSKSKTLSDYPDKVEAIDEAILRTEEIAYFEEFGAVGDGSTNNTTAIQNAFNSGAKYLTGKSDGWYNVHSTIAMPTGVTVFGVKIDGSNVGNNDIFQHLASTDHETTVTAIVNNRTITVADIGTIEAGDHIRLFSNVLWYYDNRGTRLKGETTRVKEVDGSNVILYDALHDDYDLAGSETLGCHTKKPVTFRFKDVQFRGNGSSNGEMSCIRLYHTVNDVLENIETEEKGRGITLTGTYQSRIINPSMKGKFFAAANGTYGIVTFGAIHAKINGGVFTGHRSPIDFSGGSFGQVSRHCHAFGCDIDGAGNESSQFDGESRGLITHGTAEYCTFESCTVRNVGYGVVVRGRHHMCLNNRYVNVKEHVYRLGDGAEFEANGDKYLFETKGSYIDLASIPATLLPARTIRIVEDWNFDSKLKFHNCELYGRNRMFDFNSATWGTDPMRRIDVQNNTLGLFQGNIAGRAFFHSEQGAPIEDSIISNNVYLGTEPLYNNTSVDDSSQVYLLGKIDRKFTRVISSGSELGGTIATTNRLRVRFTQSDTSLSPIFITAKFAFRSSSARRGLVEQKARSEGAVTTLQTLTQTATGLGTDTFEIVNTANATTYDVIFNVNQTDLIGWTMELEVISSSPNDTITITQVVSEAQP